MEWVNKSTVKRLEKVSYNPIATYNIPSFHPQLEACFLKGCFEKACRRVEAVMPNNDTTTKRTWANYFFAQIVSEDCPSSLRGVRNGGISCQVGYEKYFPKYQNGVWINNISG